MEYYWDTDPGEGHGIALSIPAGTTDSAVVDDIISSAGLNPGLHVLYVRSKSTAGTWGIPDGKTISVLPGSSTASTTIVQAEYFWDNCIRFKH
jgi:hypothetical protein